VVNTTTLLLIQNNLEELAAILLGAGALANDLDRVDEVGKESLVDSRQCARAGALLRLGGAAAVRALGAWQNAAGGEEDDLAVGELLLELTGEAVKKTISVMVSFVLDMPRNCILAMRTLWVPQALAKSRLMWKCEHTAAAPCGNQRGEELGRRSR
jgi:hypothetical protein